MCVPLCLQDNCRDLLAVRSNGRGGEVLSEELVDGKQAVVSCHCEGNTLPVGGGRGGGGGEN